MIRAIRAKFMAILTDRVFLALLVAFYAYTNYMVLAQSGLLQPRPGGEQLNQVLRYSLLINNFHISCQTWGLFLPIFLGCRILADDRVSGQLYVALTANPRRARFLLGNWAALAGITVLVMGVVSLNYWVLAAALEIRTVASDFFLVMGSILMNMVVLLTVTAAAASVGNVMTGVLAGLGALTLFNLAAYQSIPFVTGGGFDLSYPTRRLLMTLCPIKVVYAPSAVRLAAISQYIVTPYLIPNTYAWQAAFVCLALGAALLAFELRDI
ncbi:MAG: hypothetical protein K6T75_07050 [Acetobacteraceae bacterium]|nr:hypothetical protein [Acetobacteraceae bacterium]